MTSRTLCSDGAHYFGIDHGSKSSFLYDIDNKSHLYILGQSAVLFPGIGLCVRRVSS
jgi:hypothetical protein